MMASLIKVLSYILQGDGTRFNDGLAVKLWENKVSRTVSINLFEQLCHTVFLT